MGEISRAGVYLGWYYISRLCSHVRICCRIARGLGRLYPEPSLLTPQIRSPSVSHVWLAEPNEWRDSSSFEQGHSPMSAYDGCGGGDGGCSSGPSVVCGLALTGGYITI